MIGSVKMKRENTIGITIIIVFMLFIFSGCQDKGLDKEEIQLSDLKEDVVSEQESSEDPNINEDKANSDAISYILRSSQEIYLENFGGSKNLVSLSPDNKTNILDYFNDISLIKDNGDMEEKFTRRKQLFFCNTYKK